MFGFRNRRRPRAAARTVSPVRSAVAPVVAECLEQRVLLSTVSVWVESVQSTAEATPQQAPGKFRFHASACTGTGVPASVTVTFQLSGTASSGGQCGGSADYEGDIMAGTVTVPVNGSADVTFDAIDDQEVEPIENVLVTLTTGDDYSIPAVGVTGREALADIVDDDVNIFVDDEIVSPQELGADPVGVTVTDYYGSPKAGIPLDIDYYDHDILAVDWSASGSTTDANGHATLMVGGVDDGSSPLRVKRLAKSGYGEGQITTDTPDLILPANITVPQGTDGILRVKVVTLHGRKPWPGITVQAAIAQGAGGFSLFMPPGENGKTDQSGICRIGIRGILANGAGGDVLINAVLKRWVVEGKVKVIVTA